MGDLQDPKIQWSYVNVPYFWPYFFGDIPLHSPYIGLIYGRYLQFRILKFPLTYTINIFLLLDIPLHTPYIHLA